MIASFKGVPFEITDGGIEGGRNRAVWDFPFGSTVETADLGLKARKFSVSAFVLTTKTAQNVIQNYKDKRNDLIQALESSGSGTLMHPWFGELTVVALSYKIKESTKQGGMANFEIEFTEEIIGQEFTKYSTAAVVQNSAKTMSEKAVNEFIKESNEKSNPQTNSSSAQTGNEGSPQSSQSTANGGGSINTSETNEVTTNKFNASLNEATAKKFSMGNEGQRFLESIKDAKNRILNGVGCVRSTIARFNEGVNAFTGNSEISWEIDQLMNRINELLNTPQVLAAWLTNLFDSIRGLAQSPDSARDSFFGLGSLPEAYTAMGRLIRNQVVATQLDLLTRMEFISAEKAVEATELAEQEIDKIMADCGPEMINTVREIRAALDDHRRALIASLPKMQTIELTEHLPALALAYEKEMEFANLMKLNNCPDPLALLGKVNIHA